MKTVRIISLILVLATLCCAFIACDSGEEGDIDLPEREFYNVKVSFQIKSADGKTQLEATDYIYKGHAEPTILNVIDSYVSVATKDWYCTITTDKDTNRRTLTRIGGMKANINEGTYWGFVTNTTGEIPNAVSKDGVTMEEIKENISLREDMSAINLSLDQIKSNESEGSMDDTYLVDGAQFTVILLSSGN